LMRSHSSTQHLMPQQSTVISLLDANFFLNR